MVNIGIIGCGYWGPNLVRNFYHLDNCTVSEICDTDTNKLEKLRKLYPSVETSNNYKNILNNDNIEAVVISTPGHTHYEIARDSLNAGKHVFVEKPLALTTRHCSDLVDTAQKMKKILMVGHTFLYNAAVLKLKEYIDSGEIGDVMYIYSARLNLGKIRGDLDALWNFAPHDVSILCYLLEGEPESVRAKGYDYLQDGLADVVFMTLDFPKKVGAHIHISWLDPAKVRKMTIVGTKKMIIYDDVSADAKIQVFDKGVTKEPDNGSDLISDDFAEFQLKTRSGDIYIPKINFKEPLHAECSHFVECIISGVKPLTDGKHGLSVVKILEAASESIKNKGEAVELK